MSESFKHITWKLAFDVPPGLRREEVRETLRHAMDKWEQVCGVRFTQCVGMTERAQIYIRFGKILAISSTRTYPDGWSIMFVESPTPWMTYRPGIWDFLKRRFVLQAKFDLFTYALHELGHVLGLTDSENLTDAMSDPSQRDMLGNKPVRKLSQADIRAANALYPDLSDRASWRS